MVGIICHFNSTVGKFTKIPASTRDSIQFVCLPLKEELSLKVADPTFGVEFGVYYILSACSVLNIISDAKNKDGTRLQRFSPGVLLKSSWRNQQGSS